SRPTTTQDTNTSPKKNDQSAMGWVSSSQMMSRAKLKMLSNTPENKVSKKLALANCQACLTCPRSISQAASGTRAKAFNSSSYTPVIKAMVPPDTPGTTSAAPMAIPLRKTKTLYFKVTCLLIKEQNEHLLGCDTRNPFPHAQSAAVADCLHRPESPIARQWPTDLRGFAALF